ncbi:MAG: hypothetical protein WBV46_11780 [Terriglobales bacterium]|jgi:hypothetical protein
MKFAIKLTSGIVAVLLIATLTSADWAAPQVSPPSQLADHSGGCHGHNNSTPNPKPAHNCCLSGHDAAILQVAHAQRPTVQHVYSGAFLNTGSSATASLGPRNTSLTFSAESPGITPLRI